jgi:hypothetical protein
VGQELTLLTVMVIQCAQTVQKVFIAANKVILLQNYVLKDTIAPQIKTSSQSYALQVQSLTIRGDLLAIFVHLKINVLIKLNNMSNVQ